MKKLNLKVLICCSIEILKEWEAKEVILNAEFQVPYGVAPTSTSN
jgi:hypothetical protein